MAATRRNVKPKKKKAIRLGRRSMVGPAILNKGFEAVKFHFQTEVSRSDAIDQIKTYVKNSDISKQNQKYILANPDYTLFCTYYCAAAAFWVNVGQTPTKDSELWKEALDKRLGELIELGKPLYHKKKDAVDTTDNVVSLSPQQRLRQKIDQTIMQDLDDLEEAWINGEKASIDVYALFRKHGLGGSATLPVRRVVEGWLLDYEDAYKKRCEQAVEGYSHLKRPELNRRLKECQAMLDDLDRIKNAAKATRAISIKKAPSLDKQVAKVKYKKEDSEYKIASIPPVQIIGKKRLFVFNTKYRKLMEYVTDDPNGFTIQGTTIKNYSKEKSRSITLRKPLDILPKISQTTNRFRKIIDGINAKASSPNGRLNEDTVLLKVDVK